MARKTSPATRGQNKRTARPWNLATAYRSAVARIREAGGGELAGLRRGKDESPVAFARRMAELAAPADMRLSLALGLGTTNLEHELYPRAMRLRADLSHKRLAIVGLRAGETLQDDGVSDRFSEFLTLFTDNARRAAPPAQGAQHDR